VHEASGHDPVNHPAHYTQHPSGVETIEIVEGLGFCLGNAWKYLARHRSKGKPVEDLAKARWYLQRELICQRRIEMDPQADPVLEAKRRYMASEPDIRLLKLYGLIWSVEEGCSANLGCDRLVEAIALIDALIDETRKERSDVPGNV
jgi:hypothetical protein